MLFRRDGAAVLRKRDVVDREDEMVLFANVAGPLHAVDEPQQGDDMARAGLFDGGVQPGE